MGILRDYNNPSLTVEAHAHCDAQLAKFRELLRELNGNPDIMLCYVATDVPANRSINSPIAIIITPTPGGVQYGISEYRFGVRGSGSYYQMNGNNERMEADILKRLRYYHRTTPLAAKLGCVNHDKYQFVIVQKP